MGCLELSHHQQAVELILTRLAVNLGAERAGGTLNNWISVAGGPTQEWLTEVVVPPLW